YVITSGKLYADAEPVQPRLTTITAAAISSMLYASNRSDVGRLYSAALIGGFHFHLLAVPQDFPLNPHNLSFEQKEMQGLFEIGRQRGQKGEAWRTTPPGAERSEQLLPRTGMRFVSEKQPEPLKPASTDKDGPPHPGS